MSTDTIAEVSTADKSAALVEYGTFAQTHADKFQAVKDAEAALDAAKAELAPVMDRARELVGILGSDMLGLLPNEPKVAGKRGPRDPSKRAAVLAAMQNRTISEIVAEVGRDDVTNAYVTGIVNSIRTADKDRKAKDKQITVDESEGRGNFKYTFVGEVQAETPSES